MRTRTSSTTQTIGRTRRIRSNRKRKETSQSNVNIQKTKCSSESKIELKEKLSTISSPKNHDNDETNKSKIVVKKEQGLEPFEYNPESTSLKTNILKSSIKNVKKKKKKESKKSPAVRTITLESSGFKGFDYMLQKMICIPSHLNSYKDVLTNYKGVFPEEGLHILPDGRKFLIGKIHSRVKNDVYDVQFQFSCLPLINFDRQVLLFLIDAYKKMCDDENSF